MEPIKSPKGAYRGDPPGRRPDHCPQCGCVLEHFHAQPPPTEPQKAEQSQEPAPVRCPEPPVAAIDLFASKPAGSQTAAQEPIVASVPAPLPAGAEVGDFVAEPTFARTTEMQTKKAKDKRAKPGVAPGAQMPSKPPIMTHPNKDALQVLDDPKIGGKVTICVLLFGDHHTLHRRCLTSIVETVPPSRMDLRVATNQVCLDTRNFLNSLPVSHVYDNHGVRRKYGAMRDMFYDPARPIETPWTLWFDDDSYARKSNWLVRLGQTIVETSDPDVAMLGVKMLHPLKPPRPAKDPRRWFRNGKWWRNLHLRTKQGSEAPNGNCIHFVVGGFWALRTNVIECCDIPDIRLNHNGGDICIGEQLHQLGFRTKQFNKDKEFVHTSAAPRRGYHEQFPWYR